MTDFLTYIATWSVLKWVLLVLIAGFIGQFGKMLANAVIARVRLRRTKEDQLPDNAGPKAPSVSPPDAPQTDLFQKPAAIPETPDKKALKIMAKARKKEAKKN